jgi:hypothetical protein
VAPAAPAAGGEAAPGGGAVLPGGGTAAADPPQTVAGGAAEGGEATGVVKKVVLRSAFEWCVPQGGGGWGDEAMREVGGAAGLSASAFGWQEEPAWKVQRVA